MSRQYQVINPYNNELLGEYRYHSWEEVQRMLSVLKNGQYSQKKIPAFERANILRRLADLIQEKSEEIALLITKEVGKTISDSRVEVMRAINTVIASSEESRQITGETLNSDAYPPARNKIGIVRWQPLGTILCITSFNFPINIALHKIGPAFAAGNAILFKPAPQNTASSKLLIDLCYQAGMPENTIKLCIPELATMSQLISHDSIDGINFTGGTHAADAIAEAAGYKKLLLELGGNDPLIVMEDGDIQAAVEAAINQRFATAGQRCTAAKRVFIHEGVYDEFVKNLVASTKLLKVGDPEEDDTFVGPVVNQKAAEDIQSMIDISVNHGASITLGGYSEGNVVFPTILENIADDADIMVEEVFGPVMPIKKFSQLDDIIPIINNSPYGLQAGVFTQDITTVHYLHDTLNVGTLAVNDGPGFRAEHFPFGGVQQSGIGREGIKYAIREMSYQKTLVL